MFFLFCTNIYVVSSKSSNTLKHMRNEKKTMASIAECVVSLESIRNWHFTDWDYRTFSNRLLTAIVVSVYAFILSASCAGAASRLLNLSAENNNHHRCSAFIRLLGQWISVLQSYLIDWMMDHEKKKNKTSFGMCLQDGECVDTSILVKKIVTFIMVRGLFDFSQLNWCLHSTTHPPWS